MPSPGSQQGPDGVTVTFAGSGDAFGSGGRLQACIHMEPNGPVEPAPVLLDCGATSLPALRGCGLDPGPVAAVFVSHLHGDHFGGLPFLILDAQFAGRTAPLAVVGPPGTGQRLTEAMECMFPGSSRVRRRFAVEVAELRPGGPDAVMAGVRARARRHTTGWSCSYEEMSALGWITGRYPAASAATVARGVITVTLPPGASTGRAW